MFLDGGKKVSLTNQTLAKRLYVKTLELANGAYSTQLRVGNGSGSWASSTIKTVEVNVTSFKITVDFSSVSTVNEKGKKNDVTFSSEISSTPIWLGRTAAIADSVKLYDQWPALEESMFYGWPHLRCIDQLTEIEA